MYDLIGLGEDGLIYQLVEMLVLLCVILNMYVFCLVDVLEIVEVWEFLFKCDNGFSVLVLFCQKFFFLCEDDGVENMLV